MRKLALLLVGLHHWATATGGGEKAGASRLMLYSLTSTLVLSEGVLCSQGCWLMSSRDGRSEGRRARHHRMSCWHSGRAEEPMSTAYRGGGLAQQLA